MNIALLGYGKMGKVIEKIAIDRGHSIILKVGKNTADYDITKVDIAIDFSIPSAAVSNISTCLNHNIPVVSGTTGWLDDYDSIVELCNEKKGAFIYASNFSLGVNVFFELNKTLAKMMRRLKQYNVSMEEIHHTQKLDAPSGTAISLTNDIIEHTDYTDWKLIDSESGDELSNNIIPIEAKRIEKVPGTHIINYQSEVDTISIEHVAHSRHGFALGAVIAAEWLLGKVGVYSMNDVLNIG